MPRLLFPLVVASVIAIIAPARPANAQVESLEHEIKAAFLYNFVKFVQWPASSFPDADAPLTICLMGPDPFGTALDDLIENEQVEGRPLAVRRLGRADATAGCHVLFVAPAERARYAAILRTVDTRRVLTVSDAMEFLAAGGHISFFMESNRVRFAVNAPAARQAEFQINSRLMRLARIHEGPDGGQP
jgi:hypothetical protein